MNFKHIYDKEEEHHKERSVVVLNTAVHIKNAIYIEGTHDEIEKYPNEGIHMVIDESFVASEHITYTPQQHNLVGRTMPKDAVAQLHGVKEGENQIKILIQIHNR